MIVERGLIASNDLTADELHKSNDGKVIDAGKRVRVQKTLGDEMYNLLP